MTDAQCKAVNADGLRCVRDIAHEGQHAVPGNLWDTPLDSEPPSDEEVIRAALRRLNPEFHKSDSAWPALDRLTARLTEAERERDETIIKASRLISPVWRASSKSAKAQVRELREALTAIEALRRYQPDEPARIARDALDATEEK